MKASVLLLSSAFRSAFDLLFSGFYVLFVTLELMMSVLTELHKISKEVDNTY